MVVKKAVGTNMNDKTMLRVLSLGVLLMLTSALKAETQIVIVQGLAGEDYYQRHFDEQVEKITEASSKLVSGDNLLILSGEAATRDQTIDSLQAITPNLTTDDQLLVYLIGHGSFDGRDYKFNLSGADLTGAEILEVLGQSSANNVLINTTSSSGALLEPFEDSNVHLVAATKSGAERTATRFGRHFADALVVSDVEGISDATSSADLDKNQAVSLKEAFDFAVRETADFYESEGLLATENARIQMVTEGDADTLANSIKLANLIEQPDAESNPALALLLAERDAIDRDIDTLRLRRIGMTEEDYLNRFQSLMIELAQIQFQIDKETGADDGSAL